jgi:hypothetical protein
VTTALNTLTEVVLATAAEDKATTGVSSTSAEGSSRTSSAASNMTGASGAPAAPSRLGPCYSVVVALSADSLSMGSASPVVVATSGAADSEVSTPDSSGSDSNYSSMASKIAILSLGRSDPSMSMISRGGQPWRRQLAPPLCPLPPATL